MMKFNSQLTKALGVKIQKQIVISKPTDEELQARYAK
jgi:hypothetical protein